MDISNTIKALWTSESINRLFTSSGIGFIVVSPEEAILDVSQSFCEKIGYPKDELLKLAVSALTHPDDRKETQNFFQHAWQQNRIQVFDKRYRTKTGATLWCRLRSEGVKDETGKVICRIVMVEDITKAKNDEIILEQMAAITEASDDAIFRSNAEHIIEFWGKGAERLYGYTAQEAIGQPVSVLSTIDSNDKLEVSVRLSRGEAVIISSTKGKHKDGDEIHISVLVFPIRDKDRRIIAYAAVHRDIRDIKKLETQLLHSQRMETAGLLAGGIAHDFNNLLTVIRGSCNFLADALPENSAFGKHLEQIDRSTERASQLTRQLLAFSRKQNGTPVLLDPRALLAESVSMLNRTLGDNVVLNTSFQSTWCVMADPTQLEQILLNLAVNARHAMPEGGTLIIDTCDIEVDHPPFKALHDTRYSPGPINAGQYVRLTVTDTGSGMDESILAHIFDPFFTTKPKGEGTGLGLSVVYGMITQMGGGISVNSQKDKGTSFQIYLPKMDGVPVAPPPKATGAGPKGKGRILLIEDDDAVRALTSLLLEAGGYRVYQASNAAEVLQGSVETDVDLILSDVMMPGMSGPEFSEVWLRQHPETKFLFMSGYFDEDTFSRKLSRSNLLQKPFKPADLLRKVEEMIRDNTPAS